MNAVAAFVAGLVFGIGLLISGMTNPAKVIGFLDIAGAWDPSLALVMAGAVATSAIGFAIAKRRDRAILGGDIQVPSSRTIDRRLLIGSAVFGIGWGIAGFCPGPALVALGMGQPKAMLFVACMVIGMAAYAWREGSRMRAATVAVDA